MTHRQDHSADSHPSVGRRCFRDGWLLMVSACKKAQPDEPTRLSNGFRHSRGQNGMYIKVTRNLPHWRSDCADSLRFTGFPLLGHSTAPLTNNPAGLTLYKEQDTSEA